LAEGLHGHEAGRAIAAIDDDLDPPGERTVVLHDRRAIARQDGGVSAARAAGAAPSAIVLDQTTQALDGRAVDRFGAQHELEAVELGRIVRSGDLHAAVDVEDVGGEVQRGRGQLADVDRQAADGLDPGQHPWASAAPEGRLSRPTARRGARPKRSQPSVATACPMARATSGCSWSPTVPRMSYSRKIEAGTCTGLRRLSGPWRSPRGSVPVPRSRWSSPGRAARSGESRVRATRRRTPPRRRRPPGRYARRRGPGRTVRASCTWP